jgi:hypothetical protein
MGKKNIDANTFRPMRDGGGCRVFLFFFRKTALRHVENLLFFRKTALRHGANLLFFRKPALRHSAE